jgi:hypothetical protein
VFEFEDQMGLRSLFGISYTFGKWFFCWYFFTFEKIGSMSSVIRFSFLLLKDKHIIVWRNDKPVTGIL